MRKLRSQVWFSDFHGSPWNRGLSRSGGFRSNAKGTSSLNSPDTLIDRKNRLGRGSHETVATVHPRAPIVKPQAVAS